MVLADISFTTEGMVAIGALLSALVTAVVTLHRTLMASKDKHIEEMRDQRDSYKEIATEAVSAMEVGVNAKRAGRGFGPTPHVPAVVPEHNSPTTRKQQDTADLQTMRARLTAATLELGLPARVAGGEAPEAASEGDGVNPQAKAEAAVAAVVEAAVVAKEAVEALHFLPSTEEHDTPTA